MSCLMFNRLNYSFDSEETRQTLDSIRPVYENVLWGKVIPNYKFHGKIPNSLRLHCWTITFRKGQERYVLITAWAPPYKPT